MTTTAFVDPYGNLNHEDFPANLAYQPSVPVFRTHPEVLVSDLEQMILHLGLSAGNDYLQSNREDYEIFEAYQPAVKLDFDRAIKSRGFWRDSLAMTGYLFNVKENNYLKNFGRRSWNQCVVLLQGMLVIGAAVRMLKPVLEDLPGFYKSTLSGDYLNLAGLDGFWENLANSTSGQLQFIYAAPFFYRWWIAVWLQTDMTMNNRIKELGGDFADVYTQLQTSVRRGDVDKVKAKADQIMEMYLRRIMGASEQQIQDLKQQVGEDIISWGKRVEAFSRDNPPLPEVPSGLAKFAGNSALAVVTTAFAMKLFETTFEYRPFLGDTSVDTLLPYIDLVDWNFLNGIASADSVPAVMAKALTMIMGVWMTGHAVSLGFDYKNLLIAESKLRRARELGEDTTELEKKVTEFRKSIKADWDDVEKMPGGKLISPRVWAKRKERRQMNKERRVAFEARKACAVQDFRELL